MNEEDVELSWTIDSSKGPSSWLSIRVVFLICTVVFNKVVTTALKYTPVILDHHIPYKSLADGRLYVLASNWVPYLTIGQQTPSAIQ